jgi:cbb3-type cytochrome oxidase subunit 1
VLALAAAIPTASSLGRVLQGLNFSAGFTTLWVTGMGVGLAYYTVVKITDQPLANRQLAKAGFWSLAFAASWAGPLQVVFGPTPDWLDAVAAVLTLALPVAAGANAIAIGTTVAPAWSPSATTRRSRRPWPASP